MPRKYQTPFSFRFHIQNFKLGVSSNINYTESFYPRRRISPQKWQLFFSVIHGVSLHKTGYMYFRNFPTSCHTVTHIFNLCCIQSIDQYKIKVLVFSIQYPFKILKYQYLKHTEVSLFRISIFCENYHVKMQQQIRTTM